MGEIPVIRRVAAPPATHRRPPVFLIFAGFAFGKEFEPDVDDDWSSIFSANKLELANYELNNITGINKGQSFFNSQDTRMRTSNNDAM